MISETDCAGFASAEEGDEAIARGIDWIGFGCCSWDQMAMPNDGHGNCGSESNGFRHPETRSSHDVARAEGLRLRPPELSDSVSRLVPAILLRLHHGVNLNHRMDQERAHRIQGRHRVSFCISRGGRSMSRMTSVSRGCSRFVRFAESLQLLGHLRSALEAVGPDPWPRRAPKADRGQEEGQPTMPRQELGSRWTSLKQTVAVLLP